MQWHQGCFRLDRAFPWACLGQLERRTGRKHGEKGEEWQKTQVQWFNLLAFADRQKNNYNYSYYLSNIPLAGKRKKGALLRPPNFKPVFSFRLFIPFQLYCGPSCMITFSFLLHLIQSCCTNFAKVLYVHTQY